MKSYRIHLIRHGVSEGAEKGQYIGATDSPLSENGKNQLKALALSAQYPKADAYFCSANQRCRESLELLYPGTTGTYLRGLEGCNFGEWEGKTAEELLVLVVDGLLQETVVVGKDGVGHGRYGMA